MEKLKKFFKSLIIRLVICENLVLASMLTQSLGTVSYLFLCAIPVVLFWRIGILKLCWKIIKGFFSIFAGGGSSNSSSADDGEPEKIIAAYEQGTGENRHVYIDTTKRNRVFIGTSGDKLSGYTSSTVTLTRGRPGVSAQGYGTYTYDINGSRIDFHSF